MLNKLTILLALTLVGCSSANEPTDTKASMAAVVSVETISLPEDFKEVRMVDCFNISEPDRNPWKNR